MADFTWDENKRRSNLAKHELDFADVEEVFSGDVLRTKSKYGGEELRWVVVGRLDELIVTVVFTIREGTYRIISMRRAKWNERREYQATYGG